MSGLIPRPSLLGFDLRDADARSNGLETTRERRPGVSVDRRQRTASWITTTFFIFPTGFWVWLPRLYPAGGLRHGLRHRARRGGRRVGRAALADGGKHDRSRAAVTGEDMPRRS